MKLTAPMIRAVEKVILIPLDRFHKQELQALLDHLDPIPANVGRVQDRWQTTWRRSVDDPQVWTTAGRSRVATTRHLIDTWGPLTW